VTTAVSIWLVLILGATASLKAWRTDQAAAALATYGVRSARGQRLTVWALISAELTLAGALLVGVPWAAGAIAGLFLGFAVITLAALLAGRGGRPCACFGTSARLGWSTPLRALALAGAAAAIALGWLPDAPSGYARWLTVSLSVGAAAIVVLGLAVLALAREVGVLRLGLSGRGALEIQEEGPELGAMQGWAVALPPSTSALLGLAVFTSEGCPLCRQLEPAVRYVAADPLLAVRVFDEVVDVATWTEAGVPGSPYAVVLDRRGVALAKGTFNSLAQLESVVGTARAREQELAVAA
jgi:hypothetical protein